ncbi:MAG: hypothetical protein IJ730_00390 [Alphaproteobacteria bacterium]|nr:hypothetical protein [Alphaproteobacteria bacterium]
MMFVCIVFLFSFQVCAMDFAEFKTHIVGKTGAVVHDYITPLLKDGLDARIDALCIDTWQYTVILAVKLP